MGFNVYSLPHFFPYQYWESPVDTSISATKYITLDSIHYTCFLTWPHMAQGYCQDPGQDKMDWGLCLIPDRVLLIVSLQELGGIISVYSDQEKLLRPPGGDHWLLTSWILPRWLPLSQDSHQQFSHSKSLRRKILVPIILTVKKNQSVNKSFII